MQPYPVLETLFRHNLWANLCLLEFCATLDDEQLEASAVGGFGSIAITLRHIVHSERSYFTRISTGQSYRPSEGAPPLTFDEMAESLRLSGEGLIEWASKVQATDGLELKWNSETFSGTAQVPKAIILTQAINHATEHRAQILVILTQLGIEPPDLSSWSYFDRELLS